MGPVAPPLMRPNEPGSDGQVVDQAQCHLDDFPDVGFVVDIQSRFELRAVHRGTPVRSVLRGSYVRGSCRDAIATVFFAFI